jgi:hypothetical protein
MLSHLWTLNGCVNNITGRIMKRCRAVKLFNREAVSGQQSFNFGDKILTPALI